MWGEIESERDDDDDDGDVDVDDDDILLQSDNNLSASRFFFCKSVPDNIEVIIQSIN